MSKTVTSSKKPWPRRRHPTQRKTYANLLSKWEGQFQFEGRGDIESILEGERCRGLMDYIEWGEFEVERESLKRFYNTEETEVRLANYTEHYAKYFTQYAFNFRLSKVGKCLEKRKRKLGKLMERKLEAEFGSEGEDEKSQGSHSLEKDDFEHHSREIEIRKWQKRFDKVRKAF